MGPKVKTAFDRELERTEASYNESPDNNYIIYNNGVASPKVELFNLFGYKVFNYHLEIAKIIALLVLAVAVCKR